MRKTAVYLLMLGLAGCAAPAPPPDSGMQEFNAAIERSNREIAARMAATQRQIATENACIEGLRAIRIGMLSADVKRLVCAPKDVRTTTTATHTEQQWTYDWGYLYFEDGRLDGIQY